MCNTTPSNNDLGLTDKNHACSCCGDSSCESTAAHGSTEASTGVNADAIREHYLVQGMTCEHCVASVTEEITALDGVDNVRVDLNAGGTSRVMVVSSTPVSEDAVRTAVAEAGYELVSAAS